MAFLLASCATPERQAQMRQTVEEGIATRHLHIDIRSMNTLRYGARAVSPDFFLELRGDTLRSYLPYLGQAHLAPMASPPIGLNFEVPMLRYAASRVKANRSLLEIEAKTQEDYYCFSIEVYDTGEANIRVRMQNRDPISFDGWVTER